MVWCAVLRSPPYKDELCESCLFGKHTKATTTNATRTRKRTVAKKQKAKLDKKRAALRPLSDTSVDFIGARHKKAVSPAGYSTGALFFDWATSTGYFCPLQSKVGATGALQRYKSYAEHASGEKMSRLFSDSEQVLKFGDFQAFCDQHSILQAHSPPHRHDLNNFIERYVRTTADSARSMMIYGGAPPAMWPHAYQQATYVRNRLRVKQSADGTWCTPNERLTSATDEYGVGKIRVLFCAAYAKVDNANRTDLEPKATLCVHLGSSWTTAGAYRLLNLTTKQVIESFDVVFNEVLFPFKDSTTPAERQATIDLDFESLEAPAVRSAAPAGHANSPPPEEPPTPAAPAAMPAPHRHWSRLRLLQRLRTLLPAATQCLEPARSPLASRTRVTTAESPQGRGHLLRNHCKTLRICVASKISTSPCTRLPPLPRLTRSTSRRCLSSSETCTPPERPLSSHTTEPSMSLPLVTTLTPMPTGTPVQARAQTSCHM